MTQTVSRTLAERAAAGLARLGELSPSQLAIKLRVSMESTTQSDRLAAVVKYLNGEFEELRLTATKLDNGRLEFATAHVPALRQRYIGKELMPPSVLYYVTQPTVKSLIPKFSRGERGALAMLAAELGLSADETLRRALQLLVVHHRPVLDGLIGSPAARRRNAERLEALAKDHNAFWAEVDEVLRAAVAAIAADFMPAPPETGPIELPVERVTADA